MKPHTKHTNHPAHPKQMHLNPVKRRLLRRVVLFGLGIILGSFVLGTFLVWSFDEKYKNRVYPGVTIASIDFSGKTPFEVQNYWQSRNNKFQNFTFTFQFENETATLSANTLDVGFDATLSATQAYSVGRSGSFLTDTYHKLLALQNGITLSPFFRWNEEELDTTLETLAAKINVEPENALFEFTGGRVTVFKPATSGRFLDTVAIKKQFAEQLVLVSTGGITTPSIVFTLPVIAKEPLLKTEQANNYGIKELIGRGESWFKGSIPGRIHNVALAASRVSGVLIPPGKTFSFNQAVGDITAATGYKQAYVIKSGRTVLDDGGGVCQVSTTLFRAALNTGLPITERHAHSYRVGYYEQGGVKPGFDATVYDPTYDLKIVNDTPTYILIQAIADTKNTHLVFELYGQKDGRVVEMSAVRLWDKKPAPPDLYQDDPTLPTGQVKQVDWANPGVKAAFDYKVTKNGEITFEKNFYSNFIPWQAVYLRGTGPN